MKKALLCGLLAAAILAIPAKAARQVPVQVDGALLESRGTLEDGVTYVPLRSLLDHLGGWELTWDSLNKQAVATSGHQTLIADPNTDTVILGAVCQRMTVQDNRAVLQIQKVQSLIIPYLLIFFCKLVKLCL